MNPEQFIDDFHDLILAHTDIEDLDILLDLIMITAGGTAGRILAVRNREQIREMCNRAGTAFCAAVSAMYMESQVDVAMFRLDCIAQEAGK